MDRQPIFNKNDLIDKEYIVQFFIELNDGGEIYRVKDSSGNLCRLKIYESSSISNDRKDEEGGLKEVNILTEIDHPNIINLIDSGEFDINGKHCYYLVTEFVSGETSLKKLQREGPQNPYFILPIAISLLKTIKHLHDQQDPVIHNDITPENVILCYDTDNGEPILTNFSSATTLSQSSRDFQTNLLDPFYMAPEQFNGITVPQSDLYSIGAFIYQMCFGMPPYYVVSDNNEELHSRLNAKRMKALTFESEHMEVFDDQFMDVLRKALAPELKNRFRNADEFIRALNRDKSVELSIQSRETDQITKEKKKGPGFTAIAGMDELKDLLTNDVIKAITEKELYESYGITIPNGLLLYGPPGCGKTFISERFAEEVGFNFVKLNPSDVKSKYVNATEENIGNVFKEAAEQTPSVLFFDEMDALVPSRESDLHHMNASAVNEFLAQMSNCAEKGIFVIAATNRPDKIDPAILRTGRIDKKVYVSAPDEAARKALFEIYLQNRPTDFSIDCATLAAKTEFYVASDIKFLVDEASRAALKTKSRITQSSLIASLENIKPSIKKETLDYYMKLKNKIEDSGNEGPPERRPVGFK